MAASLTGLHAFFEPRTVAVVGVSRARGRIGSEIFHNLVADDFCGRVFAVNTNAEWIDGRESYRSVRDIPGDIDLAVIAVPVASVERVVDDCIAKRVTAIVVISAGFAETGNEGRARQDALLARVRAAGIRMVGPNCMGLLNTDPRIRLNATFAPAFPPAGRVAFSSQSGALGLTILDYVRALNLGISMFVSVGNRADVSSNDLIEYWSEDPRTDVILLYLESFGNPLKFRELARNIGRRKPIVAVKAGRSAAGARAAQSHTGSLMASDVIVDALFHQTGVIRTHTLEELFDVAMLLANQPLPAGGRVGILTNAGGPGILAADAAEALGLQVPTSAEATMRALRAFLPTAASVSNPVDMLATATADDYRRTIPILLADDAIDSLMVIFIPPLVTSTADVALAVGEATRDVAKPVLATFLRAQGALPAMGRVPCFLFPEPAIRALGHVVEYSRWRDRPSGTIAAFRDTDPDRGRAVIEDARMSGAGWLRAEQAAAVLDAFGIPATPTRVVTSEADAVAAAMTVGLPAAIKAGGPTLVHKTESHAVIIGLRDAAAVRAAYRDLMARLGSAMTHAIVQPMVADGAEVIVGAVKDKTFGYVILCGSGGALVELIGDRVCRLHPLTDLDAEDMVSQMRGVALLRGFRGAPQRDEAALRETLLRVSAMLTACPEIQEMDINPLMVLSRGVSAVDVRIRLEVGG